MHKAHGIIDDAYYQHPSQDAFAELTGDAGVYLTYAYGLHVISHSLFVINYNCQKSKK